MKKTTCFSALLVILFFKAEIARSQSWALDFETIKTEYEYNIYSSVFFTDDSAIYGNFSSIIVPGQGQKNFRYIARLNQQGEWAAGANVPEFSGINSTILSHTLNNNLRYLGTVQADSLDTFWASNIYIHNSSNNTFTPTAFPVFDNGVRLFGLTNRYIFLFGEFTRSRMSRSGSPALTIQLPNGAALWDLDNNTPAPMPLNGQGTQGLGGNYLSHAQAAGLLFVAASNGFRVMKAGATTWQDGSYPGTPAGGLFRNFCIFSENEVYGVWRRNSDGRNIIRKLGQGTWDILAEVTNQTNPGTPARVNSIERLDDWLVITHTGTHFGNTPVDPVFAYNTRNQSIQNLGNPLPPNQIVDSSFTKVIRGNLYFFTMNESLFFENQKVYALKFTAQNALEYEFTGNGNWTNPANWKRGFIPPSPFPAGKYIYINPQADGECVLDKEHIMLPGSHLILRDNKRIRVQNLTFQ